MASGDRVRTVLYILFNSQDLGNNIGGMSDAVRKLCMSDTTCLREILKESFEGEYTSLAGPGLVGACCSVCDTL